MKRVSVRSTEIALVGYDESVKMLEITFRRGGVYQYRDIPADIYQALMKSDSIGTFFSNNIKDRYSYEKVS